MYFDDAHQTRRYIPLLHLVGAVFAYLVKWRLIHVHDHIHSWRERAPLELKGLHNSNASMTKFQRLSVYLTQDCSVFHKVENRSWMIKINSFIYSSKSWGKLDFDEFVHKIVKNWDLSSRMWWIYLINLSAEESQNVLRDIAIRCC